MHSLIFSLSLQVTITKAFIYSTKASGLFFSYLMCNVLIMSVYYLLCLYRLTGFQVPPPVTSTGNVFSLRLTSDFAVSAHGFKLNYEGQKVSVFVFVCLAGM